MAKKKSKLKSIQVVWKKYETYYVDVDYSDIGLMGGVFTDKKINPIGDKIVITLKNGKEVTYLNEEHNPYEVQSIYFYNNEGDIIGGGGVS